MGYRYATERADHSALASGQVLRSAPGYPGFPVRLASELFQRALAHVHDTPVRLWDPCCGGGYLVTVLGLLHRDRISHVRASDVDADAVELAARNLELLTASGLAAREAELRRSARDFGRVAFVERAEAAADLAAGLAAMGGDLPHDSAVADVFTLEKPVDADLVVTDVPYGEMTRWSGAVPGRDPVGALLASLGRVLPDRAVVVVTARTRRIALPEGVRALERVRVGNRSAVLVRARDVAPSSG
ncbi:rRNA methyltransferase [Nocardiopsis sp. FIRDI 009]|uniref:rRNA methyltransferase n=1 Tax=Nocardiopsis sp. FIRDI 009 TaxID=714197 RepID=UPI000E2658D8|nr:rRNA methyltransferase [Nocardiopsis sp. FIRDI 009]